MSDDDTASVQMSMVRAARVCTSAKQVWSRLCEEFPEFTESEIKDACRPVIERMYQNS